VLIKTKKARDTGKRPRADKGQRYMHSNSFPAIVADYGPNLQQAVLVPSLDEIHQLFGYRVAPELAKKAEGDIAEILHSVQRPAVKQRQEEIAEYIEKNLLNPRPLDVSYDQGYFSSICVLANHPLKVTPIPGIFAPGLQFATVEIADDQTFAIPGDGAGRMTGWELLENLYGKQNADVETRRRQIALKGFRIATLILFPKPGGELTVKHMQNGVYDMNVLATPLTATQALNRDNRTPYNRIAKEMVVKDLPLSADQTVRFVKIALEGAKAAEKAGAKSQATVEVREPEAATNLAFFWKTFIANLAEGTLDVEDNMVIGASGIASLALVAHELFYARAAQWEREKKAAAIAKIAAMGWLRTTVDADGKVALNEQWAKIGVAFMLKPDKTGKLKAVMGGAGANNQRLLTKHLFEVAGIDKLTDEPAPVAPTPAVPATLLPPEIPGGEQPTV
jgi:hypothetical protein